MRKLFTIWRSDYYRHGGADLRDYIKVLDLAQGHMKILHWHWQTAECRSIHMGIGIDFRVFDVVPSFDQDSVKSVHNCVGQHYPFDIAACYANPYLSLLGWRSKPNLVSWCWKFQNPQDYSGA
jgi:UDP-glucose 4-epimerase